MERELLITYDVITTRPQSETWLNRPEIYCPLCGAQGDVATHGDTSMCMACDGAFTLRVDVPAPEDRGARLGALKARRGQGGGGK